MTSIDTTTRLGRMIDAGRLTATVTSKKTGSHLTVTFKTIARDDNGKYQVVGFGEGLCVVNEGKGAYGSEKIGRVGRDGNLSISTLSKALAYAAKMVWQAALSAEGVFTETVVVDGQERELEVHDLQTCQVRSLSYCGMCGRELTDPESIDRGVGPECNRKATGSKSARAKALAEAAPVDQAPSEPVAEHTHTDEVECDNCGGTGVFKGGGIVENGVYKGFQGTCYRCGGTGKQTQADQRRNWGYDNFYRRAYA